MSSIIDTDYNGIITSDVISKVTTENLKIIYDIFDKLLSGKLFENNPGEYFFYTLFNQLIIESMSKIFNIIDKIEKSFKLPDIIQRLINTCTDKNREKRQTLYEYDYFFEKNEEIQYQSVCFNLQNLSLLSHLLNEIKKKDNFFKTINNDKDKIMLEKIINYGNEFNKIYNNTKNNSLKCEYFILNKLILDNKVSNRINTILKDNLIEGNNKLNFSQKTNTFIIFKKCLSEILGYTNIIDKDSIYSFTLNKKKLNHNYQNNIKIYKKIRNKEYNTIMTEKNKEEKIIDEEINFKDVLFKTIMDNIKNEIGFNYDEPKSQRIIFCTTYIQNHIEDVPKEYSDNNYSKLFLELIKETSTMLHYLNKNILNKLYNKFKEGEKLNMIIFSNCLQIKSLEKIKCIEYLYSKMLIPNSFIITKDEKGIVTKVDYVREKQVKTTINNDINNINEIKQKDVKKEEKEKDKEKKEKSAKKEKKEKSAKKEKKEKSKKKDQKEEIINIENKNAKNNNKEYSNNIMNENNQIKSTLSPSALNMELIKKIIHIIPNYREYEKFSDDLLKFEENTGISDALKNFFRTMKILVKKEKIVNRFSKEEINSIAMELENYILFKLYDKLYPTKSSKDDIRFYKKCNRLNFIKPHNLITDKNIVNENMWKTAMEYLNKIDEKFTPVDKIKIMSKAFGILQNSITFCSGKKELGVDDTLKPLIYLVLKSKPKNICNNFNYCQLFLSKDLIKKEYGMILTQVGMIMNIIKDMKYNDLIGVTEKQFGKDEDI